MSRIREILLCKNGEIALKGANRMQFETMLCRELKYRLSSVGHYDVIRSQSTIRVEPKPGFDDQDRERAFEVVSRTFGIISINRCAECEKSLEDIGRVAVEYLADTLRAAKTFKVESKRSDKRFPLDSMALSRELGGILLEAFPHLKVDVHTPDVTVICEVRETAAYVSAGKEKGAGGMPVGSNGKALLLLSGGIDSPVAGYMMAKRGVKLEAVYFESFPYTSEQAREKVLELARLVSLWAGSIYVHVVSLTHIQEELVRVADEDYFTLLLRRYMMKISERIAKSYECGALITGESMGQVASQTMQALAVTNAATDMPIFRPCIGLDKEEIVTISRHIGTFETSILPYEDCCTVFTPKHPKTRPELAKVLAEEEKLDMGALIEEALATDEVILVKYNNGI